MVLLCIWKKKKNVDDDKFLMKILCIFSLTCRCFFSTHECFVWIRYIWRIGSSLSLSVLWQTKLQIVWNVYECMRSTFLPFSHVFVIDNVLTIFYYYNIFMMSQTLIQLYDFLVLMTGQKRISIICISII